MDRTDSRTVPEELLLLHADPRDGRIRTPSTFHRVLAGGVLAELLVTGAISVDGRHITGYRPLGQHDPVAAGVLAELGRARKGRPPGLDRAVRRVPRSAVTACLHTLAGQGAVRVERRRLLGVVPYRRFSATTPQVAQQIAGRLRASVLPVPGGAGPVERDRQLAALVGVARLDRRLYPGPENKQLRRAVRVLARDLPIARAVKRVLGSDAAATGS
ncbi:GPP34 family phosphoprotein [Kitasatospora sp. NPDC057223]|uniref:GOLPH3/VPS74 family protein n=1 Tax=Kitasatospora sp. NPDC057223 TaxID=3346055 RepID=UPI003634D94E